MDTDSYLKEMNMQLASILQRMYKMPEQSLGIVLKVAYASDKGIYFENDQLEEFPKGLDVF